MAGDVDDVVGAAEDEVVAVLVPGAPVEGGVDQPVLETGEVGLHETLVLAPHRAHAARRQRRDDGDDAFFIGRHLLGGLLVQQAHVVAVGREGGAAELGGMRLHAGQAGEQGPAGLGLPVVVVDRLVERLGDPLRRRFVKRFAGEENMAQRGEVVLLEEGRVLLLQHADGGRRGEHHRDLVILHDLPPDAGVGAQRRAFVDHRRHAVDERAVDDVGMAHHPADVGGGEIGFARVGGIDMPHRGGQRHGVATGVALHALRLAGGAGGVQDVGRMRGLDPGDRHLGVHVLLAQHGVVEITAFNDGHGLVEAAIDDQHLLRRHLRQAQRFVHQVLVGHRLAAAHAGVRRDHDLWLGVVDAGGERTGGEAAKHHRVDGTDAHRGEHRENRLGDHRHVDQHAVALAHSQALQHGRHALHFGVQLGVGVGLLLAGLGRDVDQRRLLGAILQVPVNGVVAEIGFAADEPLGKGRLAVFEYLAEGLVPIDQLGLLAPERIAVFDRAAVKLLVFRSHHPLLLSSGLLCG